MWLSLNYDFFKKPKVVILITLIIIMLYQAVVYLHPDNMEWVGNDRFSLSHTLWFVFVDQFMIECVTVGILFFLIRTYAIKLKLAEVKLAAKDLGLYQLKFLPLFMLAYFVFAPFSMTIRFLLHQLPNPDWDIYFKEYFYSTATYFNYMTPVILVGYVSINVNLLKNYNDQLSETRQDLSKSKKTNVKSRLWASDDFGEVFLDVEKIHWIVREERKLWAQTDNQKLRLKGTLSEVQEKLDEDQFVQVNRSTIVSLQHVLNYSFWEHDKYILRMKGDQEFIMSRDRLNKIKDRLLQSEPV